jgi:hypothetical protein
MNTKKYRAIHFGLGLETWGRLERLLRKEEKNLSVWLRGAVEERLERAETQRAQRAPPGVPVVAAKQK